MSDGTKKGCGGCKWRFVPSTKGPCLNCNEDECDRFELHEWTKEEIAEEKRKLLRRAGLLVELTEADREFVQACRKKLFGDEDPPYEKGEKHMSGEIKGCGCCLYKKVKNSEMPCRECDGFELDKFEFFDWKAEEEKEVNAPDPRIMEKDKGELTLREFLEAEADTRDGFRDAEADAAGNGIPGISMKEAAEAADKLAEAARKAGDPAEWDPAEESAEKEDPVYAARIKEKIRQQVKKGREKYGVTLDQNETLTTRQRIEHLEEELIDGLMYCEHLAEAVGEPGWTANDYQRAALRTAQMDRLSNEEVLLNGVMGLNGEAGEVIDLVKKARFQGHELDTEKLMKELGDIAWYLAITAISIGYSLSDVFDANIEKLQKRYPDGFDKARSMNRTE